MCGILCILDKEYIKLNDFLNTLQKLQNRGQNSFGFFYPLNNSIEIVNIKGLIKNYENKNTESIHSNIFMGHTRYITSGSKDNNIALPIKCKNRFGEFVFIFNGNIDLKKYNKQFTRSFEVDTLLIKDFLENCSNCESFEQILIKFINTFERSFSLVIYFNNTIYCIRDRYGVRPISYSQTDDTIIISSEFEEQNINIESGEIVKIHNNKIESIYKLDNKIKGHCLFEYIYFMNKETIWNKIKVSDIRGEFGKILAKFELDNILQNKQDYCVIGIPNSGICSAKTYAKILNIEYNQLISKNMNINRTFILNTDSERLKHAKDKYIFSEQLKNKKIILFDDSIVRGLTMKLLIKNLKLLGVNEIHVRIAAPQIKYECKYGIDIPTREELLMNKYDSIEESQIYLGCNSLKFTNLDEIKRIIDSKTSLKSQNICTGCFNNNYNLYDL